MTHTLQCVWPIVDDTYTVRELIAEASPDVVRLARQAHAVITGDATWRIADSAEVPGFTSHPGPLLVAEVPAAPQIRRGVRPTRQLDSLRQAAAEGRSDGRIAAAIGCTRHAVLRARQSAGIPSRWKEAAA